MKYHRLMQNKTINNRIKVFKKLENNKENNMEQHENIKLL